MGRKASHHAVTRPPPGERGLKEEMVMQGVKLITLDRPRKKNAITGAMYLELSEIFDKDASNDEVSCIVITGTGDFFSSGADLNDASWSLDPQNKMDESPAAIFMRSVERFPKLVVAAVNGPAVGIAATLLCHVDICYCTPEATIWTPFFRMAIVPEYASSSVLPLIVGRSKASEMLFLGKKMTATEAQTANLVSEVIPRERLLPEILSRLEDMLKKPLAHKSIQVFKRLIRTQRYRDVDAVITAEFNVFDERLRDGDVMTAIGELLRSRL